MQIEWITVSAQIVNFLILVWLLKRFLYQPVMRNMERREKHITDRLIDAQEREQEAAAQTQLYQNKCIELDHRRDEILEKAHKEAGQQKKELLEKARFEVAEIRAGWQHQADLEKHDFLLTLQRQSAGAVYTIARKALSDLADTDLETQIVHHFIKRLHSLDKQARKALRQASKDPLRIASSFELNATVRGRLTRSIHEEIGKDILVAYTHAPELLCGIELTRGGQRLSWNLAEYMDELDIQITDAFKAIRTAEKEEV